MTFALGDLCFMDFETKAFSWLAPDAPEADVTKSGAYRYAENAFPVILTYGIGDADVVALEVDRFDDVGLTWAHMPADLKAFHARVVAGTAHYVAWNSGFDRQIMRRMRGAPPVGVRGFVDAMAQAVASNLPPALDGASKALGRKGKFATGKGLIGMFAPPNATQPAAAPDQWDDYVTYALQDTEETRAIWQATRALSPFEWREFWANETINDRGVAIDTTFARSAAALADYARETTNKRIDELTGGVVDRVTQAARIASWLYDNCGSAEVRDLLTKEYEAAEDEEAKDDEVKLSATRDRMAAVVAYYDTASKARTLSPAEAAVAELATLREFGGSASPYKFRKMLDMASADGALRGQYVFNGAPQSGRFSSRGVQIHNLTRKTVGSKDVEADAIERIRAI